MLIVWDLGRVFAWASKYLQECTQGHTQKSNGLFIYMRGRVKEKYGSNQESRKEDKVKVKSTRRQKLLHLGRVKNSEKKLG